VQAAVVVIKRVQAVRPDIVNAESGIALLDVPEFREALKTSGYEVTPYHLDQALQQVQAE
jgi:hypothetical protein